MRSLPTEECGQASLLCTQADGTSDVRRAWQRVTVRDGRIARHPRLSASVRSIRVRRAPQASHATAVGDATRGSSIVASASGTTMPLTDEFRTQTLTLTKITKLCTPVNKNGEDPTAPQHAGHLVCYKAKLPKGKFPA